MRIVLSVFIIIFAVLLFDSQIDLCKGMQNTEIRAEYLKQNDKMDQLEKLQLFLEMLPDNSRLLGGTRGFTREQLSKIQKAFKITLKLFKDKEFYSLAEIESEIADRLYIVGDLFLKYDGCIEFRGGYKKFNL